jgi:hypothetical protein
VDPSSGAEFDPQASERFRPTRGVGIGTWLVNRATRFIEARSSRRGFLMGTAVTGSALAVGGVRFATRPGSAYALVTGGDCPPGSLCRDGFTEFCCSINNGSNSCPPGSFAGGWWRADFSSFCNGTRYYIDCMQHCCGPEFAQGGTTWCAGCVACQCGPTCDNRKVYCNYFRYGQCHQEIAVTGPIACRVVTCVPPYMADPSCSPASAVDNNTAEHGAACLPGGPPRLSGTAGELIGVTPARILDTRDGTGRGGVIGKLNAGQPMDVLVTGVGGVPATGVEAVVMNVTVTEPTDISWLAAWPAGTAQPLVSNLNFVAGETVPNLVMVKVGASGRVRVANHTGATHVIWDVVGWYATANGALAAARFRGLRPARLLDTRAGIGAPKAAMGPDSSLSLKVTGVGGVPAAGVTGVAMNVTVTEPTAAGYLTVHPSDAERPLASNLNFVPGQTVPNLVVVRVPPNGLVNLYNFAGSTHVVADVVGWFDLDRSTNAGRFVAMTPVRVLDTRVSGQILTPGQPLQVNILGEKGIPAYGVSAIVANVTITQPTASSYVTVYPADAPRPVASNLNFVSAQTVPNLVMVKLSSWGTIAIFNLTGTAHAIVDVAGYFLDGSA